jgi:4-hydroxy-tetrahydrodipicolinate synthase
MASYRKAEARAWGRANMQGCVNVTIPSFSADLKRLNEKGIRHDIRRAIEFGFEGTLLVSEVNITHDEYVRFTEIAADEAKGRLHLVLHASFDTLEDNIEMGRRTAAAGMDYVLLSYPANFYPGSQREIFDYTKAFCDGIDMGVMLFPVPLWNFGRLHPADIAPEILEELVREVPNIMAIKAEGAMPTIGGLIDVYRRLHEEVVISCPLEKEIIPLMAYMKFQYSGTSYTEYFGDLFPKMFRLAKAGDLDGAFKLWWQIHPARLAVQAVSGYTPNTLFLNRMAWKYQGWLQGMNGGPLRRPTMKIPERDMNILRQGLVNSGLEPTKDPNSAFFIGRNPT